MGGKFHKEVALGDRGWKHEAWKCFIGWVDGSYIERGVLEETSQGFCCVLGLGKRRMLLVSGLLSPQRGTDTSIGISGLGDLLFDECNEYS